MGKPDDIQTSEAVQATLLNAAPHSPDFDAFLDRLNGRLPHHDFHSMQADTESATYSGGGIELSVAATAAPLGAETFMGAIAPDSTPATRAALTGIVAHHSAHVTLSARLQEPVGDRQADARWLLQVLHAAVSEFTQLQPALALHWNATNKLHHADTLAGLLALDTPLPLFLHFADETTGPRRNPGLRIAGALPWLGLALHVQTGARTREQAKAAALAFVAAAMDDPSVPLEQAFHHDGYSFRLAHAPDGGRIDLIPTATMPDLSRIVDSQGAARSAA